MIDTEKSRMQKSAEMPGIVEETLQSYWLVAKYCIREMQVLTLHLDSGEEVLPVFTSSGATATFFRYLPRCFSQWQGVDEGWYVRESTTGELISLLFGPCRSVDHIALNLRPETDSAERLSTAVLMPRKDWLLYRARAAKTRATP